jgi:chorismate dehydratase
LTGHLLRKDCLTAPIPTADYARFSDELLLLPDIGISSRGAVGSVLLFGERELENVRDIAVPTDSSTSRQLLRYLLARQGLDPHTVEMGPDLELMLDRCDAALLIGDRALDEANNRPELILMDLGTEWQQRSSVPMVFGVFAVRKDAPIQQVRRAHRMLSAQVKLFESSQQRREAVISETALRTGFSTERLRLYFQEVRNVMGPPEILGLRTFLTEVCKFEGRPLFIELS